MAQNDELPEGSEPPKKKSKLKLIIILLALILLLGGGGLGAYWFLTANTDFSISSFFSSDEEESAEAEGEVSGEENASTGEEGASTGVVTAPTQLISLPALTINLADTGTTRYLRIGIDIEVSNPDAVPLIESQTPKIRDAIIILLSGKTYAELSTADGKFQLKNEIASRINQIIGVPRVLQIYYTDFVVQ